MLPSVCLKQQQQQQRINGTDLKLKNRPTQTGSIDFDKGTKRFSEEKTDFAAHGTTAIEHPEAKKKKKSLNLNLTSYTRMNLNAKCSSCGIVL